ncbi:MAG TPA: MucB/RseB C-terminal domain-containing protein [Abditibacteriaceae bacterium]|jgi:negative regulator of sigma E activity
MMPNISRALPLGAAAFLLGASAWVWKERQSEAARPRELLERTYHADNEMQYAAISKVTALYGTQPMNSTARVVRAPRKLSITYIDGDMSGLQSGYNERWFWRRDGKDAQAFAEVTQRPQDMAARRYSLLTNNYRALDGGQEVLDGRPVGVLELRPQKTFDGAVGPYKRLWVDEETGLTMRTDSFNYEGRLVMRTILSNLDLKPEVRSTTFMPPEALNALADKTGWIARDTGTDAQAAHTASGLEPPRAMWLPTGFELDGYGVHQCPSERVQPITAALSRYTDGLNTLTIFVMNPLPGTPSEKSMGKKTDGPKSCDFGPGTMAMSSRAGKKLIAVGDLPPATLSRVLEKTSLDGAPPGAKSSGATTAN